MVTFTLLDSRQKDYLILLRDKSDLFRRKNGIAILRNLWYNALRRTTLKIRLIERKDHMILKILFGTNEVLMRCENCGQDYKTNKINRKH